MTCNTALSQMPYLVSISDTFTLYWNLQPIGETILALRVVSCKTMDEKQIRQIHWSRFLILDRHNWCPISKYKQRLLEILVKWSTQHSSSILRIIALCVQGDSVLSHITRTRNETLLFVAYQDDTLQYLTVQCKNYIMRNREWNSASSYVRGRGTEQYSFCILKVLSSEF